MYKFIFRKIAATLLITLLVVIISMPAITLAQDSYKIGVLAKRGALVCMKKWQPTADYVSQVTGKKFEIVPLDFEQIKPSVKDGDIHFVLANSSFYVDLNKSYGVKAIASLINSRQGKALNQFAGVIFVQASRSDINSLEDLKGKSFMAVKESSFGGWQMAARLLKDNGINPETDFSELKYGGKHDNVLLSIKAGIVDAGTVRSDTYERMVAEGKIMEGDFKVIHKMDYADFPFLASTRLYPEWPMGALASTPADVVEALKSALTGMPADSEAAKAAKCVGWSPALDYAPVDECLQVLGMGPYKKITHL